MRRIPIPASPQDPNPRRRFLHDVVVILGDDIQDEYNATAKDLPDDLPQSWTDPDDEKQKEKKITWISNFGLTKRDGTSAPRQLPQGKKFTVELPRGIGDFVFFDGTSVRKLPVRTEGADKFHADFTLTDPPVGVIK